MSLAIHYTFLVLFFNAVFSKVQPAKVAVVTGANKGLGYEIVKGLCEKYDGHVYLTSRDENRGKIATQKLKLLGLNPYYHQLDVTDPESINRFRDYINETEGGIDVLINNAGISYLQNDSRPLEEQEVNIIKVNYFGLLQVSTNLFPLLRQNGRVINISSAFGILSYITSNKLRSELANPSLTIVELNALMNNYIELIKKGTDANEGWPSKAVYKGSKIGVSALTFIQQRDLDKDPRKRNLTINCVTPGYVATDLTYHLGTKSAQEGARLPLYLALENHGLRGKFLWSDFKVFDWYNENI